MSNRFYFDNSDSEPESNDIDPLSGLPFPKPLSRSSFLGEDFDPASFLASLTDRFQTLEDLQVELQELSSSLNKELVDLVNDNYQDFLALGLTLSGGREKVEEIRVGLLAFQRDVSGVRELVDHRRKEIAGLVGEMKILRRDINLGRSLMEIEERMDGFEQTPDGEDEDFIQGRVEDFLILRYMMDRKEVVQHPFVLAEQSRFRRIKERLLAEIDNSIKNEPDVKVKQKMLQIRSTVEDD